MVKTGDREAGRVSQIFRHDQANREDAKQKEKKASTGGRERTDDLNLRFCSCGIKRREVRGEGCIRLGPGSYYA